jgi:signal transduction histidine kinase
MEARDDLFSLTEEHWQAIEQLNDVLVSTTDLQQVLKKGLEVTLSALASSGAGAALYLPRFCENISQDWSFSNLSAKCQSNLENFHPPYREMIAQVMASGGTAPAAPQDGLAAIFPVSGAEKVIGALLVFGTEIGPEAYPRWQAFTRPFARMVSYYSRASGSLLDQQNMPSYRDLIKSRNTLRAMFDSLPISIYIIDSGYRLAAVNNSRAARAGDLPKNLVGGLCYEKLYQRSSPCPGCLVTTTFGSGQDTVRLSREGQDHERSTEWEISTFPIQTDKEPPAQTIIVEADVTEKRNLEANLIQSEKLAAVGQLAAGVAHEINNPLTAIIANAQLLNREIAPGETDLIDSVKLIEMAGTRASQVVRNLLGIARKEKYQFEPIDLNETLQNALSLVQHELVGRPIQVILAMDEDMPQVIGSQDQLQGVWINLFLNAIDAIDKQQGEISISSRFTGSQFQVVITDNGKGITPDHMPRVFEPFFTTKVTGRGTGLGLSVCMRVIRHHGGSITVESQPGAWTRFTVSLPVK